MSAAGVGTDETIARRPARRRPLSSRLSAGHVVMAVAGLLGFLLTLTLLDAADETVPVAVAASDIEAGERIDAASFGVVDVRADAAVLDTLVLGEEIDTIMGHVAGRRIGRGELVSLSDLETAGRGAVPRSMSFSIDVARALDGVLNAGDRVDVVAAAEGAAHYVLADVEVLAVDDGGRSGALQTGGDALTVTVAVRPGDAVRLAAALDGAEVTLVRSTGAVPLEGASPTASEPGAPSTGVVDAGETP